MSTQRMDLMQPLLQVLEEIDHQGLSAPESPTRVIARVARFGGVYPTPNLAVSLCEQNYVDATTQATAEGKSESLVRLAGKLAFCTAMPKLSGAGNIRDFIACVTYGMLLGLIAGPEGTRLLYAAQVAHIAHAKHPKKRGKSSPKSAGQAGLTDAKSTA